MSERIGWTREQMAQKAAEDIENGFSVNLGIGIPTLVSNYIPDSMSVMLQSENGLLGMGPFPTEDEVDPDLINAGKQTITSVKGASYFSSAESFAMIRGQHVDLTVLGAMEVSMDLVASAKKVIVVMQHCDRQGNSKLVKKCSLPLTGINCVSKVITDLGVFAIRDGKFHTLELADGVSEAPLP